MKFQSFITVLILFLIFLLPQMIPAQVIKQIKIGSLQSWFSDEGSEIEEGFRLIQQYGLSWPSQYQKQDNQAAKALWIGTTNYTDGDQYGGNTYLYKVVHIGPRGHDPQREFMPIRFDLIGRFNHPQVYVDGIPGTALMWEDEVDIIDPDLPCDRMLYNVVNTSIGITMTRKIMAWGQQYHDNYFIYDYVFKNTGNIDPDPEIEKPNQVLTDVYFFWQYRYATGREADETAGFNSPRWGINKVNSTRGEAKAENSTDKFKYIGDYEDYLNGVPGADSLRCQLCWNGRFSKSPYDYIGVPDVRYGTGRWMSPQFIGNVTLHADKSPSDKSDDPQQPTTTTYQQSDDPPTRPNDQFDAARMADEWKWITRGHRLPRHDEVIGDGFPDNFEGTPGGFSSMNGYGPYTLKFGDSIHIVIAEGCNGINRKLCEEYGKEWIKAYKNPAYTGPFPLPNGSTTTDKDVFKNSWIMTGKDSLFKTFGRARRNYSINFKIPNPPPPPAIFTVNSGGDRIMLSWSKEPESYPGFAGYKIYRAIAKYDTTYDLIFACGAGTPNPLVNSYNDMTAARGQQYYYYITAFDDGSNNKPEIYPKDKQPNPGGVLESSMFWTRTTQPAYLRRAPVNDMDSIRVVPNPFNTRSAKLQYLGAPDKIMFLNIPGECTIKIFTERGDLIKTINHINGSGDEWWNSNTDYGQVVVSGVYIVVFETPDGRKAIRKFVVIR